MLNFSPSTVLLCGNSHNEVNCIFLVCSCACPSKLPFSLNLDKIDSLAVAEGPVTATILRSERSEE